MTTLHEFSATTISGEPMPMSAYEGRVVLVVNVASRCGFTGQYAGLEELYERYVDRGLVVLGFPCDQFGNQEPGSEAEIQEFCTNTFGVSFPMFAKVEVNGDDAHPIFAWLREQRAGLLGGDIKWNFTKFLLDPCGQVVKRYSPATKPEKTAKDIERLLPA
jgi:glutathione peroxidase